MRRRGQEPALGAPWSELSDYYGLTRLEAKIFAQIRDGAPMSAPALMKAATGKDDVGGFSCRVHIQHIRAKLQPFGVRIYNDPSIGYFVEARVTA